MVDKKDLYKQIYLKVDFGLNANQQIVQKEIPELVQYDNNSGLLIFDFYNNGRKIDMTGVQVSVNFKLPSGDGVHDYVTQIRPIESRAMYFTPMGILYQAGEVIGDVALFKENIQITSGAKFKFKVIEGFNTEGIVDHEKYPVLHSLMNQVGATLEEVKVWDSKFDEKYEEINGVIDTAELQFTTQQEMFDQEFDEQLNLQDSRFVAKYDEINAQFRTKADEIDSTFLERATNIDQLFSDKSTSIDTQFNDKANAIDVRFNDKWTEIDNMFHQEDVDLMFQEKFERLEQDFAQDYTDMKQTVKEVYSSTLKYRIVE